jgi:CheY-like chemotaxis protein
MNGVITVTKLLSMTELTNEQLNYVNIIKDSGNILLNIIDDILDFSKMESGKLQLDKHPFILRDLIYFVEQLLCPKAQEKNLVIQCFIAENVPECFLGDSFRLRQILLNLINNAIKFTDSGFINITVEKQSMEAESDHLALKNKSNLLCPLMITIADTGIGISPEQMQTLFTPFSQGDVSISRKHGGTGLGLSICKSLIELMKGQIWVESGGHIAGNPLNFWEPKYAEKKGAVFYFTLPLESIETNQMIPTQLNSQSVTPANKSLSFNSLKILVADDNQVNQTVCLLILKQLGYFAEVANNGLEVLEKIAQNNYDVIIMDIHMPVMDGITATKTIRESAFFQPYIIALTANVLDKARINCLESGMNDYLTKPIDIEKLKTALQKVKNIW